MGRPSLERTPGDPCERVAQMVAIPLTVLQPVREVLSTLHDHLVEHVTASIMFLLSSALRPYETVPEYIGSAINPKP